MVSKSRDAREAAKRAAAIPVKAAVEKKIGGEKNGGTRLVQPKVSKYYPADDVKQPVPSRRHIHKPTKLRPSLTPGAVLIMLAGNHRGKRVVFLKQLESGLLLVTGPFCINGVPLRKVDAAYVLPTKTKVDVSNIDVSKYDDKYLKREKKSKAKATEEDFMAVETTDSKPEIPEARIADQKAVDSAMMAEIKKDPLLKAYLKAKFTLTKKQYPHLMVF